MSYASYRKWGAIALVLLGWLCSSQSEAQSVAPESPILDLMVLYTIEAEVGAGGASGLRALVEYAVKEGNEAMANSAIGARVRLVHFGPTNESEAGNTAADLDRLEEPEDGHYDSAHTLRETHGADLVCLILEAPTSSGVGRANQRSLFFPSNDQTAFSVVLRRSLIGTYTLIHEVGHNLGAHHAIGDHRSPGAFEYSNAYHLAVEGQTFRTIMARQFGTKIPHFSNPEVLFRGVPTGNPAEGEDPADNAQTINRTAPEIAEFRAPQQNHDAFDQATQLEGFWTLGTGDNRQASAEAGEPAHAGSPAAHSIWWQWQAPFSGTIELSTENTDFDHRIAVYEGESLGTLTEVAASIVSLEAPATSFSLPVTEASTYFIAMDSLASEQGFASIQLRQNNDAFADRTPLRGNAFTAVAHNGDATTEFREPSHGFFNSFFGGTSNSVWWEWEAPAAGTVTLNTRGTSFEAGLGVYQGTAIESLELVAEASTRVPPEQWREVQFEALPGERYAIAVGSTGGLGITTGLAVLNLSQTRSRSLQLVTLTLNPTHIELRLSGFYETPFQIERSTDLETWSPIETLPSLDGPVEVLVPRVPEAPQAFYRLTGTPDEASGNSGN